MGIRRKVLVLCLILLLFGSVAQAKEAQPGAINVQGNYCVEVVPDQALITLGVVTGSESAGEAQRENARIAGNIMKSLAGLGIKDDKIKTSQYSVWPVYSDGVKEEKPPAIEGYLVSNTITVLVDDVNHAGQVLDTAISAGANQVSRVRFVKKDDAAVKRQALEGAVKDAMAKTEAIAAVLGKKVVRVITVNESGVHIQPMEMESIRYLKTGLEGGTPVSAGTVQVSAMVQVTVEIE